jgi:hypothetical protein
LITVFDFGVLAQGVPYMDTGIAALGRCSYLKILILMDCPNVTNSGIEQLKKQLPHCEITLQDPSHMGF